MTKLKKGVANKKEIFRTSANVRYLFENRYSPEKGLVFINPRDPLYLEKLAQSFEKWGLLEYSPEYSYTVKVFKTSQKFRELRKKYLSFIRVLDDITDIM
jgi:hypothetical protein